MARPSRFPGAVLECDKQGGLPIEIGNAEDVTIAELPDDPVLLCPVTKKQVNRCNKQMQQTNATHATQKFHECNRPKITAKRTNATHV